MACVEVRVVKCWVRGCRLEMDALQWVKQDTCSSSNVVVPAMAGYVGMPARCMLAAAGCCSAWTGASLFALYGSRRNDDTAVQTDASKLRVASSGMQLVVGEPQEPLALLPTELIITARVPATSPLA